MSSTASAPPIVLIHGMWMTTLSWENWAKHYEARGHRVIPLAWPGLDAEPEQIRSDPSPLHGLGVPATADHLAGEIQRLDQPPIIMGHSFGGLFTQLLLDRGLGIAGVTLGTAAPKGVLRLPLSTLRAAWPGLKNPFNRDGDAPLTRDQFHWCFTNALSRQESDEVYDRYYIPGTNRCFVQAGYANFNPKSVTKVNYRNPERAPLLLITGTEDRICPPSVNRADFNKQQQAPSATEHKEYEGRCHFPGQAGWEEVADFALEWTTRHARPAPAATRADEAPESGAAASPSI
jgi:pimeloyl-ACP methyl ester carboxylesterase